MPYKKPPVHSQFKKGQSGNPGGVPADPVLKAIKRMTAHEVAEIGTLLLEGNLAALEKAAKAPDSSVLKVMLASVAAKAIKKGDHTALDTLLNRFIGKVPNPVELTGSGGSPLAMYLAMSQVERQALIRDYEKRLAAAKGKKE